MCNWGTLERVREGRCDEARRTVEKFVSGERKDSRCLIVAAACLQSKESWAESIGLLEAAVELDPLNKDVHYLLGVGLVKQQRVGEAVAHFQLQIDATPEHDLAVAGLGLTLYQLNRHEEAIPYLRRVAELDVLGEEPALALADALIRESRDLADAEKWLDLAASRAPSDSRIHRVRSSLLMKQGDVEGALKEMNLSRGISK